VSGPVKARCFESLLRGKHLLLGTALVAAMPSPKACINFVFLFGHVKDVRFASAASRWLRHP
jgi:hypothetical protein